MPTIELSEATFRRLQARAKPLVDNANAVIDRLLDAIEVNESSLAKCEIGVADSPRVGVVRFAATDVPPLTHTKLRSASFGETNLSRPSWNELMRTAVGAALGRVGGLEELSQITDARVVEGTKNDEGFSPLGVRDVSVQGVAANDAWRIAFGLARKLSYPIQVVFEWREKDGADRPGEIGAINWSPQS